jgi:NADH:ubiquinone oxidoreductase subunit 5 (subunit L)/multisubunit Na+/H+ antiporter MnhA subunit
VYLMTRVNPLFDYSSSWVPTLIAWVGVGTALFAATIAVAQNDIKKVLAYSTVSQLGYMFLAVGSGAYVAAIFHMITHAFFKALLFLGSGSVIHGMHDDQDMRHYGNLKKFMPITAGTFIIGWLAIAGVPPFSGFFSKDEILAAAMDKSPALWAVGLLTALLTAFYMSRQVFLTFFGRYRYADARPEEIDAAWQRKLATVRGQADAANTAAAKANDALATARTTLDAADADTRSAAEQAVAEAERVAQARAGEAADAAKAATVLAQKVAAMPKATLSLLTAPDTTEITDELSHEHDLAHRREFHPHESGWHMWVPLAVLAVLSVLGGLLNLPFTHDLKFLEKWLEPVLAHEHALSFGGGKLVLLAVIAVVAGLVGIAVAAGVYLKGKADPQKIELPILADGWKYDSSVAAFMGGPGRQAFDGAALADRVGVDGAVNGVATLVRTTSGLLRRAQNGLVRTYAVGISFGAVVLMAYFLIMAKAG